MKGEKREIRVSIPRTALEQEDALSLACKDKDWAGLGVKLSPLLERGRSKGKKTGVHVGGCSDFPLFSHYFCR